MCVLISCFVNAKGFLNVFGSIEDDEELERTLNEKLKAHGRNDKNCVVQ